MIRRRHRRSTGFALAEALVALGVAALTLALLTSATWGLRQANERRAALEVAGPADWLTTRRAVTAWTAALTAEAADSAQGRILGTSTTMRFALDGPPAYTAELRVQEAGGRYSLVATRGLGARDARLRPDAGQETVLLETREPIRFAYQYYGPTGLAWQVETGSELPHAIAVSAGDDRRLTAPVLTTRGAACLAAFGLPGLEEARCDLR